MISASFPSKVELREIQQQSNLSFLSFEYEYHAKQFWLMKKLIISQGSSLEDIDDAWMNVRLWITSLSPRMQLSIDLYASDQNQILFVRNN